MWTYCSKTASPLEESDDSQDTNDADELLSGITRSLVSAFPTVPKDWIESCCVSQEVARKQKSIVGTGP